jgi:prepilin-type N-terminal cleavage/methylation domain-containing protein
MLLDKRGFTLIELLIVVGVIAVLSVAIILVLNPTEIIRQSRDSNRLSDLGTINEALAVSLVDNLPLGNASTVYLSIPDTSATCANLGLPALPAGWSYACATTSTYRNVNGSGWIPVSFNNVVSGSPLSALPVDPTNTTSSGYYYIYVTDGKAWELTAVPESQKYRTAYQTAEVISGVPGPYARGSSLTLSPIYSPTGLAAYWRFDEGTGSTAADSSGNSSVGTWGGTAAGASGYYSSGKIGAWSGHFDGSTTHLTTTFTGVAVPLSVSAWINTGITDANDRVIVGAPQSSNYFFFATKNGELEVRSSNASTFSQLNTSGAGIAAGTWNFVAFTYDGSKLIIYVNGSAIASSTSALWVNTANALNIGSRATAVSLPYNGNIDDLRVYNRVLAPAELQALYNAGK